MLDWNAEDIHATVGVGGLGILVLALPWLDSQNVNFWAAAVLALSPASIFMFADPDIFPGNSARAAQWIAAMSYFLLAIGSISVAAIHGLAKGDGLFIGFIVWGALPCALAVKRLATPA